MADFRQLVRIARKVSACREDAEDAAQEALLRELEGKGPAQARVYNVAREKMREERGRAHRERQYGEGLRRGGGLDLADKETRQRVSAAGHAGRAKARREGRIGPRQVSAKCRAAQKVARAAQADARHKKLIARINQLQWLNMRHLWRLLGTVSYDTVKLVVQRYGLKPQAQGERCLVRSLPATK